MSDDGRDYTPVVLVDRACTGDFEFRFDGVPIVFRPGVLEKTVAADVARFVFTHDHTKVHTVDGVFVHRVALKDAPGYEGFAAQLARELGEEILEQSPIEIDTTRVEGWDTDTAVGRGRVEARPVAISPALLRERQGSPGGHLAHKET